MVSQKVLPLQVRVKLGIMTQEGQFPISDVVYFHTQDIFAFAFLGILTFLKRV